MAASSSRLTPEYWLRRSLACAEQGLLHQLAVLGVVQLAADVSGHLAVEFAIADPVDLVGGVERGG